VPASPDSKFLGTEFKPGDRIKVGAFTAKAT